MEKTNIFGSPVDAVTIFDILEDMVRTIASSKYGKKFVIIGGYSLMCRLGESFRRTSDIDLNITEDSAWLEFIHEADTLLSANSKLGLQYKIIKHKGTVLQNGCDSATFSVGLFTVKIDMNIRATLNEITLSSLDHSVEFISCSEFEVFKDKLTVVCSNKVFRRIKDLVDIYALSSRNNYSYSVLRDSLLAIGLNPESLELSALLEVDKLRHAFTVNTSFSEMDFETVYSVASAFTVGFVSAIKHASHSLTMNWNCAIGGWES